MEVLDLGRRGYKEVWDLQREIQKKRVLGQVEDTLILVEHNPVITLGKNGDPENLLIPPEELKRRGIDFFRIERGGDITFHGPGQLVGYPIFEIRSGFAGIKPFIRAIEDVVIRTLKRFGIDGDRGDHPGLWVKERKILSIGIAVKRWVSFHGFALNVNNDPADFTIINPCGHTGMAVTSIKYLLGGEVDIGLVKGEIIKHFRSIYEKAGVAQD